MHLTGAKTSTPPVGTAWRVAPAATQREESVSLNVMLGRIAADTSPGSGR
jgi:hypothetical protein